MNKNKTLLSIFSLTALLLGACSNGVVEDPMMDETPDSSIEKPMNEEEMDDEMVHDESGEIPTGLQVSENPKYEIGETVEIQTDHMEGMDGAEATIIGAFDTVAYEVSYDPTNGDPRETNHKWIIHEEIKDAGVDAIEPGTEVILNANHMEGMQGATAIIDSAEKTTVYMIDYEPTNGGEMVKNHKWVTASEVTEK